MTPSDMAQPPTAHGAHRPLLRLWQLCVLQTCGNQEWQSLSGVLMFDDGQLRLYAPEALRTQAMLLQPLPSLAVHSHLSGAESAATTAWPWLPKARKRCSDIK